MGDVKLPDVLLLGKNPPKRYYGDIAVKFADFTTKKLLRKAPSTHQYWGRGIDLGMYLNDALPDCTCAAYGHSEQIHSTRSGRAERPTDDQVRELFERTGVEQGLSNDDGRYMEGVLKSLATTGFRQADGSMEKILGYAAVNPLNRDEVRSAIWLFGGVYTGAALPLSAADQFRQGKRWSVASTNNAPGSWGGHAMWWLGFNQIGPRIATWATRVQATYAWMEKYADEMYAVVTADWVENDKTPSGLGKDELVAELTDLNA